MANEPSVPPSSSPASPSINPPPPPLLGPQARGEARAFDLTHLLPSQREVVESAARQLQQMAEASYAPRPSRTPTNLATALHLTIDSHRESRTLLLDGPRGSGKTSALLTLLQAWRDGSVLQQRAWPGGVSASQPALAAALTNPRGRILPVGIIDLQPLADGTNLLQLIASHFAHIVDAIDGTATSPEAPPSLSAAWQGGLGREPESRRCWRKLIATIAGGFDRSLQGRAAQLDLEAYALEFEQQGRHRLDLDIFYDFIESLLSDLCNRLGLPRTEAPLFVLAIDDADMAPQRSVELLWTVRALWHPRCVFILTGHSDLFQLQLRQHYIGELLRPIGHRPVPTQDQDEIARQATIMASETYEKIIPPSQRHSIRPLEPSLRLSWQLQRRSSTGETTTTLMQLLGQIRIPSQAGLALTLADYFTIDEDTTAQLSEALPERPRRLLDLCLQLELLATRQRSAKPSEPGRASKEELQPCSEAVLAIWESALLGTDPILFDKLRRQVRIAPRTGALIVGTTNPREQLEGPLTPELKLFREMEAYEVPATQGRMRVQIYKLAKLTARLVSRQALPTSDAAPALVEAEHGLELSSGLVAALRLATNVAADQLHGCREAVAWSPTDAGLRPWLAAGVYTDKHRELHFAWPLPDDLSFIDLAVLDLRWKRALCQISATDRLAHALAFVSVVLSTYVDTSQFAATWLAKPEWGNIGEFCSAILTARHYINERRRRISVEWLREYYISMLSSENGLCDVMTNSAGWIVFSDNIYTSRTGYTLRTRRTSNASRVSGIDERSLNSILNTMDLQFPLWRIYLEGLGLSDESDKQKGKQILISLGLLDHIAPDDIGQVSSIIFHSYQEFDELNKFSNAQPLQLLSIWREACRSAGQQEHYNLVQLTNGEFSVGRSNITNHTYRPSHSSTFAPWNRDIRPFHTLNKCYLRAGIGIYALDALYQCMWDLHCSKNHYRRIPLTTQRYWPGFQITSSSTAPSRSSLWPYISLFTYKQLNLLSRDWGTLLDTIPFSIETVSYLEWVDMLAAWFINEQVAVALSDPPPVAQFVIKSGDWGILLKKIDNRIAEVKSTNQNSSSSSPVIDSLDEWYSLLPLYACPESGLSDTAARGILDHFFPQPAHLSAIQDLVRLQELRIERLMTNETNKLDREAAIVFLTDIDKAQPDHPLVLMLKEHGL